MEHGTAKRKLRVLRCRGLAFSFPPRPPSSIIREKDLDEVLQSTEVYSNVSRGIFAAREDLQTAFGTTDTEAVAKLILAQGELQVSERERRVESESTFRAVASVLADKCVDPRTQRPFTPAVLERALRDVHFSVDPHRPAKAQAVEVLPLLAARFPIQRARMRLRAELPAAALEDLRALGGDRLEVQESELRPDGRLALVLLADPGLFRPLHTFVQGLGGGGTVQVLELAAFSAASRDADAGLWSAEDAAELSRGVDALRVGEDGKGAAPGASEAGTRLGDAAAKNPLPRGSRRAAAPAFVAEDASVLYARGPVVGLPEAFASRRERFAELDRLQEGWTCEILGRGGGETVDAVFYAPSGAKVGAFVNARRMALQASRKQ